MKFTCNQQTLAKALNIVSKAVTARTTIPILRGILLEVADNGKMKMCASDLDITIEETIEVENFETGSVVVPSKLFSDIIRKLPNDDVVVELSDTAITISCQNSKFNIVGLPSDDFPSINELQEDDTSITFNKNVLKDMIRKTYFAASADESKGVITGILIELLADGLNMVAIDGYRMAVAREFMVNQKQQNVIISGKIMNEINKIISETPEEEENIRLYVNSNKAIFVTGNIKIVLRLLEGEFIKYRDIIPKENHIRVVIDRKILMDSIERASLLSKEGKNNLIKLAIRDNVMTITSESEEGKVKEEILIDKEGDDLDIGFNAKYVLDVLKAVDDEKIIMSFNTGITPCLVNPVEGNAYEYLILPVRIPSN